MSILFLGSEDFTLATNSKGDGYILCNFIPNYSLILFYSKQCQHCQNLIPIFKMLPGSISGCQFGMVNVGQNKKLINESKKTILPIEFVPLIVLYIHGKPHMIYQGPHDVNEIKRFIIDVSQKINKQQFIRNNNNNNNNNFVRQGDARNLNIKNNTITHKTTPFSEGIPLYGSTNHAVSYLQYDEVKGYHVPYQKDKIDYNKYNDNRGYFK